jgi:hypothetical protein
VRVFDVFYDYEEWADRVLKHSKLLTLIEEKRVPNFSSFKIEGNNLKVIIYTRKIDSKTTEDVKKAIEFMLEVIPSLEGLPSSALGVQKHKLRNWVLYYIPLGIFLLLSALGFYWMEQGYSGVLCEDELYILGLKILTPVFLAHFVLYPFNAKFDRSSPTRIEAKIIDKYHLYKRGFRKLFSSCV